MTQQTDDTNEVAEEPDEILALLQSLEGGDEITWWDANGSPRNDEVFLEKREHLVMGDPTKRRPFIINTERGWTARSDKNSMSYPSTGSEITKVAIVQKNE